ncbi:MAG: inositol monophosphatase family protein [Candidatus Obscuribacterales bacterium]|jgi:myo-inositol-1(or 4)-monophosphatase
MTKVFDVAKAAALAGGALLKARVGKIKSVDYKSAFNLVTDVDKASEELIINTIRAAFPEDSFLAEEGGIIHGNDSATSPSQGPGQNQSKSPKRSPSRRWIIDPLDGTTNYAHSYPFFCVSIAAEEDGIVTHGVIYNPMSGELFRAIKGQGAFLNDEPIHVSSCASLDNGLLATGFPPDTVNNIYNNMDSFKHITNVCHGVRRDGSAALDLSFVACGRLDGFWERKLSAWDVAAGALIVEEAGGKVSNLEAGPLDMMSGHILASNGTIHQQIVDALATANTH